MATTEVLRSVAAEAETGAEAASLTGKVPMTRSAAEQGDNDLDSVVVVSNN